MLPEPLLPPGPGWPPAGPWPAAVPQVWCGRGRSPLQSERALPSAALSLLWLLLTANEPLIGSLSANRDQGLQFPKEGQQESRTLGSGHGLQQARDQIISCVWLPSAQVSPTSADSPWVGTAQGLHPKSSLWVNPSPAHSGPGLWHLCPLFS